MRWYVLQNIMGLSSKCFVRKGILKCDTSLLGCPAIMGPTPGSSSLSGQWGNELPPVHGDGPPGYLEQWRAGALQSADSGSYPKSVTYYMYGLGQDT